MQISILNLLHRRVFVITAVIVIFVLIVPFIITLVVKPTIDPALSSKKTRSDYSFDLSLAKIDIPQNIATLTLTPRFSGQVGEPTSNGSLTFQDVELLVDSFQGNSTFSAEIGQVLGRQEFDVLLRGNSWRYPFDRYSARVSLWDSLINDPSNMSIVEKSEYLPGFLTHSKTTPSYVDDMYEEGLSRRQKVEEDFKKGRSNITWNISRLPGDIYAAILLAVLMVISAVASLYVSRAVWNGSRPPSINTLAWLAAFLFAMFQIRASLPGDPPNGTLFDLLIFYPILVILLTEMAVVVYLWIRRDDWDLRNVSTADNGAGL